jgi:AcrR family transcriptional regulator
VTFSTADNHHPMPESNNAKNNTATRRWGTGERVDNPKQGAARILAAAMQCYTKSGVASATIDDIAEQAGVSRRTVYRYFDNKEAIIVAVVEEQAEPFFDQLRNNLTDLEATDFRQLLIYCVLFTLENGPQIASHELLMSQKNSAATAGFYLRSKRMRDSMREMLSTGFYNAQHTGEINPHWQLNDLLNWTGRLTYSFILHPEPKETVERLVTQYLLPEH